jgi:hypothetical protein
MGHSKVVDKKPLIAIDLKSNILMDTNVTDSNEASTLGGVAHHG